ncbi:type III-A CRISPR-associated RAMP protein Csm5 [Meiothermus hypogaeus]|uniref:CRISPR system Cms protein Csm5 n=2 Tax=Meiothermus hypogaeus TaxID=884155 RepID=A0A511R361_9DEIN|nr:type III-A CRISPR-associated RAMP protein Csm5 [Meiothermus hypogaeus]RIH80566.1 CRISPR type III-A/MTUBE-associated RAMP protein Csm5 [Meiothermus hypogaeus]GEM84044.1 type III-A CRISPR-associated RAMP protein Csm5 [Meiothermus hypogaeus NBRC 106114]
MSFLESYRLELETLGPIHVGTGEAFPAYSYLVDETKKEALILDAGRLLELLSETQQKNYLEAVSQGPKQAQQTLRSLWASGHLDPTPATLRRVAASQAFINTVKNATDAAGLEFRPLPRSPRGPYLPGSSIKGALRTAWLFKRLLTQKQDVEHKEAWSWGAKAPSGEWPLIHPPKNISPSVAQGFEALVLDYAYTNNQGRQQLNLHRDPFRQVRVGDGEPSDNLLLNRIGVFHPRGSMDGTVLLAETFRSKTQLRATLRLHAGLAQQRHKDTVSHAISAQALAEACWEYYQEVAAREEEFAKKHGLNTTLQTYKELEQRLQADPQAFPLRIGFGSGRMSIRLALLLDGEEGQEPKTRKTAGHTNPKDGFPLGWAIARLEPY